MTHDETDTGNAESDAALASDLYDAQRNRTPIRLTTGQVEWPESEILCIESGWVTLVYTVFKERTGYLQKARVRLSAITAILFPL